MLVDKYQQRIYAYAAFYLKDRVSAEDVTQDVFLKLWTYRDKVDEERVLGWLIRVTRNVCIDFLRKKENSSTYFDNSDFDNEAGDEKSPEVNAENNDFKIQLRIALDRLGEPYRSIVVLREIQDLKYEEISEALELPLNTVKVYLHRARKELREFLTGVLTHDIAC